MRRSEPHEALLPGSLPMVLYAARLDSNSTTWVSENIHEVSGFPASRFTEDRYFFRSRLHPDDCVKLTQQVAAVRAHGTAVSEYRWRCANGEYHWFLDRASLVRNQQAEPTEMLGTWLDVTDWKRVVGSLRESEARFRAVAETTAAVVVLVDRERVRYANPAAAAITGYTESELLALDYWQLIHPDLREATRAQMRTRLRAEPSPTRYELKILTKHGEERWLDATGASHELEGQLVVIAVAFDVTDRKHAEEQRRQAEQDLRESEERFRSLGKCSPIGIFMTDTEGRCTYTNPRCQAICGFDFDEALGSGWIGFVHPDDRESVVKAAAALGVRGGMYPSELRFVTAHGLVRWTHIRAAPMYSDRGVIIGYVGTVEDITERKQAAELLTERDARLTEANAFLEDVLAGGPGWTFRGDPRDQSATYLSPTFERLLGYAPMEALGVPNWWYEHIHPDDRAGALGRFVEAVRRQAPQGEGEYRILHKDGSYRWVYAAMHLDYDADGTPVRTQGYGIDITHRREAAAALHETQERYRSLVEASADAIMLTDLSGTAILCNTPCAMLAGFAAADELIGRNILDFFVAEDWARAMENIQKALETGKVSNIEYTVRRRDGSRVPIEMSASVVRDAAGNPTAFTGVARDITQRKQVEEALRDREARLRVLVGQIPAVLWTTDAELHLTSTAGTGLRQLDLEPNQLDGVALPWFFASDTAEFDALDMHKRALNGEPVEFQRTYQGRTYACHVEPLRNAGGAVNGTIGVAHDITIEQSMRAKIEQHARLAAVGQLAAGIAHDFNNILTVVIGVAERLKSDPILGATAHDLLKLVAEQGRRGSHLIHQILDFSRRSPVTHHRQRIDLVPVVRDTVALLQRTIPEHTAIETTLAVATLAVDADAAQLQEILTNLALNASDAMPQGGTLRIALAALRLRARQPPPLAGMPPGKWIVLSVSDDGSGMPPDVLRHVFEPFFTTKEPGSGTGLGLAQVYGLVQQNDGFIDVSTAVSQGTTFTIYLPAATAARRAAVAPPRPTIPAGGGADVLPRGRGETVLVVEDDTDMRTVHTWLLKDLGYRVVAATNAEEALQLYLRHGNGIALVLTDLVMPGLGGLALFQALRRHNSALPVLVLSGYPLGTDGPHAALGDTVECLHKPVEPMQLARALRRALEGNGET